MNPQNPDDPEQNPFKGTPFEQIFSQMGGGQMPDLGAMMAQMQRMFEPYEGHVNLKLATEVAREGLAEAVDDPAPTTGDSGAVSDAFQLAEQWLDTVSEMPRSINTTAAWSRAEWIENTIESWRELVEPIAEQSSAALGQAMPDELKAMAGPLVGMMSKASGAMFGQQFGQGLAALAQEILSSTDVGLPLGAEGTAALLPDAIRSYAAGLEISETDAFLYLALREAATHRLYAHASWLRGAIVRAALDVGRGTTIDIGAIESQLGSVDPMNPQAIEELLASGALQPQRSPEHEAALTRLETLLALAEGWVDDVVGEATRDKIPTIDKLAEATRRRRAAGGPAEQTFAALVGLELRPRRLRDAANLWAALRERDGRAARDNVWSHPDLMPDADSLDDPLGFSPAPTSTADDDFDSALAQLLDEESHADESDDSPEPGPGSDD